MWLFKRKGKAQTDSIEDKSIGTRIGKNVVKLQTAFAKRINAAVAKVPVRALKRNLIIFCVVSGGFSAYLALNGLFGKNTKSNAITIDQASVPKYFDKSGDDVNNVQSIIDEDLMQQVRTFRHYVDSLKLNDKNSYDSIMSARPGLIDSIRTIEEIYLTQQIK